MNSRLPISGTKGYTIDLLTHEIFNNEGKRLKPFVDGRGRVSVKLVREDGKRQVFVIKDIVKKLSPSEEKQKAQRTKMFDVLDLELKLHTYDQFLSYMPDILDPEEAINRYLVAKDLIPNADTELLKKILKTISRLPKK